MVSAYSTKGISLPFTDNPVWQCPQKRSP